MSPKKLPLTHFLCLPLTNESATQWQESLHRFTADIQSLQTQKSIPPSPSASTVSTSTATQILPRAIRPQGTLHLTLGVLSLTEPEKVEAATSLLRDLDLTSILTTAAGQQKHTKGIIAGEIPLEAEQHSPSLDSSRQGLDEPSQTLSPRPLILSFTGLQSMHSTKSTSLLYAPPSDATGRLYPFCETIKERFIQEGLMVEDKRPLKLHATILNTIYAGKVYRKTKDENKDDSKEVEPISAEVVNQVGGLDQEHHDEEEPDHGSQDPPAEEDKSTGPQAEALDQKEKKNGKRKREVVRFDATKLQARYADFEWARNVRIGRLAICKMGAKKILDEKGQVMGEEYTEVASVAMP
ncbi:MAG: hypothetical protein L6R41_002390 [Letrouitia leprolyta]|nr:MAG: hypothetical protein L6R41_002390 [Letrouitia leprolyta]